MIQTKIAIPHAPPSYVRNLKVFHIYMNKRTKQILGVYKCFLDKRGKNHPSYTVFSWTLSILKNVWRYIDILATRPRTKLAI